METRSKKKRIGPLPGGDRRGTPGAGAGCDSMRTVSGEELSRRASPDKFHTTAGRRELNRRAHGVNATAATDDETNRLTDRTSSPIEPYYSPSTSSYTPSVQSSPSTISLNTESHLPALNVAREANAFLPASTKAGKPRVRMRWSKEVNSFIMRTYYYITNLETDMTTYRQKMHELFTREYPGITVTEQRISDQRRTIVKNKLLTEDELNRLKEEARIQLQQHDVTTPLPRNPSHSEFHSQTESFTIPNTQNTHTSDMSTQTESVTIILENEVNTLNAQNPITETYIQEIYDKFSTTLLQYSGTDPLIRPRLHKIKYSPQLYNLIQIFNQNILNRFISEDTQLIDIHTLIYCTALVITEEVNPKQIENMQRTKTKQTNKPPWQQRLEKDIEKLRADCGRLTQYIYNNNRSNKVVKRVEEIFQNCIIHTKHDKNNRKPEEYLDTLKQKLALKVNRLRRYKKAQQRRNDNAIFTTNEKLFYRNLQKPHTPTNTVTDRNTDVPTKQDLEVFWSGIWEEQVSHNSKALWINDEKIEFSIIKEMEFVEVTETDIKNITAKLHNWKSPGIDKIHNFWYKKLTSLHKCIAKNLTHIVLGQQKIPEFMTIGITYMLPKTKHSPQPSQYRPITCLPTIYKILTSAITNKINTHIEQHNIIAEEQKGCRRAHMGCKEQLVIDSTIHKHAATKNRNLHCTYIDYQKAFDSIPHSWLIQILEIYKINPKIIDFLRKIMSYWKTTLHLNYGQNTIVTRQIQIKKGIYQGDSLSPLWFCLALNPLSHLLHRCRVGYPLKSIEETIISHLIYMDDIKLYAKSDKDMKKLIEVTKEFSTDINMQFGLDKCKTIHIIKGKIKPGGKRAGGSPYGK
ncbi:uncharacterized protein LOC125072598 [Vanessa atalanta]|uniref:uncharacterized protein LOC125072598 n=1 Tax=Vanessa atalanta TaxID=42275 RepID=UPI001FCCE600|nr:uncharacterized protein LOC125072598 [Vanessa atalanta]